MELQSEQGAKSFFQKIFSIIFPDNDPEKRKKRLLKDIGKVLNKSKYKFYKVKTEEVQPPFASLFHEIYKIIGPAQVFLKNAQSSGTLKSIVIESFMDKKESAIIDKLSEASIQERSESVDMKALTAEVKEELINFFSFFTSEKVKEVDELYNLFEIFLQFINFDYYFLLKKFDSGLNENDFLYSPRFESINGEYILDDLKDFVSIIILLKTNSSWDLLFDILKEYKSNELLSRSAWKKMMRTLDDVKKSNVLDLLIKHIEKNPFYKTPIYNKVDNIVEDYLTKTKTTAELTIQKIMRGNKSKKLDILVKDIFGTSAVSRMKYYTEKANMTFSKKMLGGYIHVAASNYLKGFLIDYIKRDVKELVDILLIRGQWTTNIMSQQLSEAFHKIMALSEELITFDESLSEEGRKGSTMRNAIMKADRDKLAMKTLRDLLKETNEKAKTIINDSAQNIITVGKSIRVVLDDYKSTPHEVLVNWKELEISSDGKIEEMMVTVYKKIYNFIQLLKLVTK